MRTSRSTLATVAVVLALTGCSSDDGSTGNGGTDEDVAPATQVALDGTDELAFEPDSLAVAASEQVTVVLNCGPTVEHTFVIEGFDGDAIVAECTAAGSGSGSFTVDAGEHVFYCSVPGHREAGMQGTVTAS